MPNLTNTQLLKAIVKSQNGIMGEPEMRSYEHSLIGKLLSNQNDVFRSLTAMKQSDEQPTKAILFNRNYVASGTAKEAAHAAAGFADSFEKDISFVKKQQKFKVSYKQAANNQFGYDEILQHNIKNAILNLYEDISGYATAWLDTNRSQDGVNSLMAFDSVNADPALKWQYNNTAGEKDLFFDNMKATMRKNKYRPMYDVIGDQVIAREHRRIGAQGSGNATNLAYTIPGINFVEEEQLTNSASGMAYAFAAGMVGMTTWNEGLNRQGLGDVGNNEGLFTTFQDPIFGMLHDLHVKRGISDTSGSAGHVQDVVDEYELTTIFTVEGAFQADALASPIYKFVQG